jgi:hypothetical protein
MPGNVETLETTEPITCTRCGMLSPPRALVCGCGFRFGARDQRALVGERVRLREAAWWSAAFGGGVLVVGIALTFVSLSNPNRGSSFVFYGMMLFGCIWLVRGLSRLRAIDQLPPIRTEEPATDDD